MVQINKNYQKLRAGYLFPEIARRVQEFSAQNPQAKIIRLGIGDVTRALPQSVVAAGKAAFDEMLVESSFKGYGPEQGYGFLRELIALHDFKKRGAQIEADEIFISDGSKCDTGNIQEIFSTELKVAIPDPVYPVYVDTNVMAGRTGAANADGSFAGIHYLKAGAENDFVPQIPNERVDLIYLCFPNNPTGSVATREQLKAWVDYALRHDALILFDAAYEAFISDPQVPHSIYEIEGARKCAIEFRSFSKTAGFTGTRCAFTVVPKELMGIGEKGEKISLHGFWMRRQSTKFNGVSYPVQKAAAAIYSDAGKAEVQNLISYYMANAKLIRDTLIKYGLSVCGGMNAPYIWLKTPDEMKSWDFFDLLLGKAHVVGTPGAGFGACGEGYFRLSAFGTKENVSEALNRIRQVL